MLAKIGGAAGRLFSILAANWEFWELTMLAGGVLVGLGFHDGIHLELIVPGALAFGSALYYNPRPRGDL